MATIAVLGTLDTKGNEHAYVAEIIRSSGHQTLLMDTGSGEAPQVKPDVTREQVAAAGGVDLAGIMARQDRGEAVTAMAGAAAAFLSALVASGKVQGVISLGGGGGTAIGTAAIVLIAVLFLGSPISVAKVVGIGLIIVGVITLNLSGAH